MMGPALREFMKDDIEASEAKGREVGREEGREEGAKAMISMCKSLERGRLDTTEIIMNEMSYSQAEAEKLVSKYW